MLKGIIDFSLKNRFIVLLATLALVLGGIYAVRNIPLDAIPDLSDVQVIIYTEWPGQAPQIVQDQVTYPITTKMLSVPKAKDAAAQGDSKTGEPAKDQAYWSGRMKQAQDQLDRSKMFLAALESRVNALNTDFVNRDDPAQRAVVERDRQRALAEMERVRKDIVQQTKAIADIEDEARRASVPPGWWR